MKREEWRFTPAAWVCHLHTAAGGISYAGYASVFHMAARHISYQRQLVFHPRYGGDFIEDDAVVRLAKPC